MQRFERQQSLCYPLTVLAALIHLEGRRAFRWDIERASVFGAFAHRFQAAHRTFAPRINHQVASDGKQPGIKTRLAIELITPLQYTHPGLLEDVFGSFAISR